MSEPAIVVDDVHLSFPMVRHYTGGVKEAFLAAVLRRKPPGDKSFWALRGISFEVMQGEVLGIIGKNGSGKSTLLRVIAGIYKPDKGGVTTSTRRIQTLELGSGFRDELTGLENIKLSGAIMGLSPKDVEEHKERIVEFAEIGDFIYQPVRTYSSGMRARLGFAVASVIEPEILLMDEVLAVGDAEFRLKSMARIEEMVSGDTTVVIVSHDMNEIERLSDRVIHLKRGKIIASGKPEAVIEAYLGKKSE